METTNLKKLDVPFTQVANEVLNNKNITARAKGIYAYLYSKPEGWDFNYVRIAEDHKESKNTILSAIHELEKAGYLQRSKLPNGRMIYTLGFNKPVTKDRSEGEPVTQRPKFGHISNKDIYNNTSINHVAEKFEEVDLDLANLLKDKITDNIPTFKAPNIKQWAVDCRLMRERDERTPEQIRYLINWSQKDDFWQSNILSMRKLREKFDQLVAQVKRSSKPRQPVGRGMV